MARRLRLEPCRDQDGAGAGGCQFTDEFDVLDEAQVVRPGKVDRGDIADAVAEIGAGARFGFGQRGDLADRQRRLRAEELRIGQIAGHVIVPCPDCQQGE